MPRDLESLLLQAHQAALQAITDTRPQLYEDIVGIYERAIRGLLDEWAKYDVTYNRQMASGGDLLSSPPEYLVGRHLYEEIREAIRLGSRERWHIRQLRPRSDWPPRETRPGQKP